MGPSILFVNRVFPPDVGATGRVLADLAGRLAASGFRVTVLADGIAPDEPPDDAPRDVTVLRAGTPSSQEVAPRTAAYGAAWGRLLRRGLALPRHDLVVTMTDPPLLAVLGSILAARHRAAALHWCQDLYPALMPLVGVRLPAFAHTLLEAVTVSALRRCDAVLALGDCMADRIAAMGVPRRRIAVLPNWPDPLIRPVPHAQNAFRRDLGIGDRPVVAYSGNFGLAHPMAGLLDAAEELQRTDPAILFLLTGAGRGLAAVQEAARRRALDNLRFLPRQPAGRLAESLSAADLHLASLDPRACGMMVPSKVGGALAAGRPVLFLGPPGSDAARLVTRWRCGRVIEPTDGQGLAGAIRRYAADPDLRDAEGRRASRAAASWTADDAARRLGTILRDTLARHGGAEPRALAGGMPHG
ncbi:glycosyltransferase family 4 protein [Azospirillum sp. SYSU D00513]|uniref:glycosyltransferase family 4 protein n=1 Tax=Azospirillum sp. SYSU D00513 TaxID=2812561 RepID=UPI001A96A5FC|nr:glycosyltransferase family 4 protein [Azospirillum sp. SYSU D00513]